jgi:hypothetical protein
MEQMARNNHGHPEAGSDPTSRTRARARSNNYAYQNWKEGQVRALNESSPGSSTPRRGYKTGDLGILQLFGCCASFSSSIVLALYVQDQVAAQHTASILLWGIVPLMLFWQCRLWLTTVRGNMHYDPIIYAAHDWLSWLVALGLITMLSVASSRLLVGF